MRKKLYHILFLFFSIIISQNAISQNDTVKPTVSFDFGLTRNKNVNLWPVFKRSKSEDNFEVQICYPLFKYQHDIKNSRKHTHLLPLFWKRKSDLYRDIRLLSIYYPSVLRLTNDKSEGYRSVKLFELAPQINFLEMSKSADGLKVQNNLFFFLWYKNNKVENKSHLIAFPFFWQFKHPDRSSNTLLPLFSKGVYNKNKDHYLVISPLFWQFKNSEHTNSTLFPIFSKGNFNKNDELNQFSYKYKYMAVSPLFWRFDSESKSINNEYRVVEVVDSLGKTQKVSEPYKVQRASVKSKISLYPIWFREKYQYFKDSIQVSEGTTNQIYPIYFSSKSANENTFTNKKVLFPIVWSFSENDKKSFSVLPFFSFGKHYDKSKNYAVITPLYWHFFESINFIRDYKTISRDTAKATILFPLYWHFKTKIENPEAREESRSFIKSKDNKVFFPFVWSFKNPVYESFYLAPLFSIGHSANNENKHHSITPFYWHFKKPDGFLNTVIPIWFYRQKIKTYDFAPAGSDTITSNLLLPLFWTRKTSFNRKFTAITPLFWRWKNKDKKTVNILFPLIWHFKTKTEWGYPSFTFLPFVSVGKSNKTSDNHLVISPFFWRFKSDNQTKNVFFPIWWYKKEDGKDSLNKIYSNVLFPIYWSERKLDSDNKVLFPFLFKLEDKTYRSFTFFPLFSKGNSKDSLSKHLAISPLFWDLKNKARHSVSLIPVFNYYTDTANSITKFSLFYALYRYKRMNDISRRSFLWPIMEYAKGEDYKYFRISPIVWYKKAPDSQYFSIQPFYYHGKDNKTESYRVFWELYKYKNEFKIKRTNSILWKVLSWSKYENNDFEFRILHQLFSVVNKNGKKERSLFPLFNYASQDNGNESLSLFFNFYHKFKQQVPGSSEYYQEIKLFWFMRIASNYDDLMNRGLIKN